MTQPDQPKVDEQALRSMETYEREDGKRGWRIKVVDDVVATDGNQGYENEEDALDSLFGIFFGAWDESFLELYAKWQNYASQKGHETPEPYVRQGEDERGTIEVDALDKAEAGEDAHGGKPE
jgi:hypothetical protein